jgi:hypothetical protein
MALTASLVAPITAVSVDGGFDIPTYVYNETTGQTYKNGAILVQSSGLLTPASTGVTTLIVGVAVQPGTNTSTAIVYPNYGNTYPAGSATQGTSTTGTASAVTPLLVVPALPSIVFEGTFANNDTDTAIAATNLFVRYGLSLDTGTGFWYVDGNLTTTSSAVCIVGLRSPQDVVMGTTKGVRVLFKFLASATLYGPTA